MDKISVNAPAKINLFLNVIRKREDDYHDIESLLQAIDIYDKITLEKSDRIELRCFDPSLPRGEGNLAFKAAALLREQHPFPGVKITLEKAIPSGAGLGGGSSDAAFVLRGLCRLYGLTPPREELVSLAAQLGSDIPFFLSSGQALIEGRGEIMNDVELPLEYEILLLSPPVSISTAEIYQEVKISLTKKGQKSLLIKQVDSSRLVLLSRQFRNDLEDVVLSRFPSLNELKRSLLGAGAFLSSMTGSGSSFFGLFRQRPEITGELASLEERGTKIFRCKPVLLPPFHL